MDKAGDDRAIIDSVCYDIAQEKEQNAFLWELINSINGSMGMYYVDEAGKLTPFYISPTIGSMLGITADQYMKYCEKDAMDCIYPDDRQRMINGILNTIHNNVPGAISFRAKNSKGTYTWLNGSFCNAGDRDGKKTLRVVFTPVSAQFEEQQNIIHNVPGGVCLYQWNGKEVTPIIISEQFHFLHTGKLNSESNTAVSAMNFELIHEDDVKPYKEFLKSITEEPGQERSCSYRFFNRKENRYVWISLTTKDVLQPDGTQLVYASYSNIDDLKQAEQKLKRNEELLELTCGFAGVWTFIYDLKTKVAYPDKNLQAGFGLRAEEPGFPQCMIDTPYVPKESAEVYIDMIDKVNRGQQNFKTDIMVQYADHEKHWLRYEWKFIEYEGDRPRLAIGYARMVDQERALVAKINMEQERLLGGDGILLAYIVSNITKNEIKENKAFLEESPMLIQGMSMDEATRIGCQGIMDTAKREQSIAVHQREYLEEQYSKGITTITLEYRRRKKNVTSWEKNILNILREPDSGDLFLYEYCYDINKEKLLEEVTLAAVNYDYERFGSINIEEDQISILEPDIETKDYHLVVKKYSDLCIQYAKEHVLDEDRDMFLGNVLTQKLAEHLKETGSFDFTHREKLPDGTIRYKQDRHSYYDKENKICLLTRSDITDTVNKEEEKQNTLKELLLKERKAAKAKSDFLSRMSHELRTPLNAIYGYAALLEQNAKEQVKDRTDDIEHLHSIQAATHYLLAIIKDILDRQKIEQGKIELVKESIDVNTYMKNIADEIQYEADKKNITFTYERLTQLNDRYYIDGVRLQQVILNLLHNAVKFTPEYGDVRFTVAAVASEGGMIALQFEVTDNGIGMSQEFIDQGLYHAFTQENQGIKSPYEGTGIGLSICKELVTLMDGEITCVSEKGKGTRFTVTIMAEAVKKERRKRRERQKEEYDLGGVHVLLCEDNPMNQDMTKRLLGRMNCEVEVADNGLIGVEKFKKSDRGYFNMVLMDLRMPVMDGFEATKAIRSLGRRDSEQVPIVALSANAFEEDVRQSIQSGMNEHLAKPVDAKILYEKIKQYADITRNCV